MTRVSALADLVVLTSGFLFVTATFDCLAAGWATTLTAAFTAVFAAGAALVFVTVVFALLTDLLTTAFFSTGLLGLTTAVLAFPAVTAEFFAGFFIAFAIGSLPSGYCP